MRGEIRRAGLSPQLQRWQDHQDRADKPAVQGESTHLSPEALAQRHETIAKWRCIGGMALVGVGMVGAMGAAASLAASAPIWIAVGTVTALAGLATALIGSTSDDSCGLDNVANPGNPVHMLMNQTIHF